MQPQVENRLRLCFGQAVLPAREADSSARSSGRRRRRAGAREHRRAQRPAPRRARISAVARFGRRRRRLDQLDDLVDVRERDRKPFEDVRALARLAQIEAACAA